MPYKLLPFGEGVNSFLKQILLSACVFSQMHSWLKRIGIQIVTVPCDKCDPQVKGDVLREHGGQSWMHLEVQEIDKDGLFNGFENEQEFAS